MLRTMCKGKIHRARVTEAKLNYTGSITIGEEMMRAADISPYELVHINSMASAVHWETYAIPGKRGEICLNGAPARLFQRATKSSFCHWVTLMRPNWLHLPRKSYSSTTGIQLFPSRLTRHPAEKQ